MPTTPGVLSLAFSSAKTASRAFLKWTAASPADAPQLQRRIATTTMWENVTGATGLSFEDSDLAPRTRYEYRVAYTGTGTVYSNTFSFRTRQNRIPGPPHPTLFNVFPLPITTGLIGDWDANRITGKSPGDAVTTFPDFSGNGNDLTGTGTYSNTGMHGWASVSFNGTTNLFKRVGLNLAGPFTVFIVVRTNQNHNSDGLVSGGGGSDWHFHLTTTGVVVDGQAIDNAHMPGGDNINSSGSQIVGPLWPTVFAAVGGKVTGTQAVARAWVNNWGIERYGGSAFDSHGITDFQIGKSRTTAGTFLDGKVARVLAYNRELNKDEKRILMDHLTALYDTPNESIIYEPIRAPFLFFTTGGENGLERLSIAQSYNGVDFRDTERVEYTGASSYPVRDPVVMPVDGAIYVAHSFTSLQDMPESSYGDTIGLGKSIDRGRTFEHLGFWDLSSHFSSPNNNNNWAPSMFKYTDGKFYISCTVNDGDGGGFGFVQSEIISFEPLVFGPIQNIVGPTAIDIDIIKIGSTYCATSASPTRFYTATNRLGPYTQLSQVLNGSGAEDAEGPFISVDFPGEIRVYFSSLDSNYYEYAYKSSTDGGATWGSIVHTTNEGYAFAHGNMLKFPLPTLDQIDAVSGQVISGLANSDNGTYGPYQAYLTQTGLISFGGTIYQIKDFRVINNVYTGTIPKNVPTGRYGVVLTDSTTVISAGALNVWYLGDFTEEQKQQLRSVIGIDGAKDPPDPNGQLQKSIKMVTQLIAPKDRGNINLAVLNSFGDQDQNTDAGGTDAGQFSDQEKAQIFQALGINSSLTPKTPKGGDLQKLRTQLMLAHGSQLGIVNPLTVKISDVQVVDRDRIKPQPLILLSTTFNHVTDPRTLDLTFSRAAEISAAIPSQIYVNDAAFNFEPLIGVSVQITSPNVVRVTFAHSSVENPGSFQLGVLQLIARGGAGIRAQDDHGPWELVEAGINLPTS